MKTKRARFRCEVPSARCQGDDRVWAAELVGAACREKCENEGSSGDVDEKEQQVSGARCQGSGGDCQLLEVGRDSMLIRAK